MAYPASTIANWLLARAKEERESLTQMKLQKLVYIAHGWNLALYGEPLILEPVEAWRWGPVIYTLYAEFARFGAANITPPSFKPTVDARTGKLLKTVWSVYRPFSAVQLSAMTHAPDTPWSNAYRENANALIPTDSILQHYRQLAERR